MHECAAEDNVRALGTMLFFIAAVTLTLGLLGGPLTLIGTLDNEGHNKHNRRPGVVESGVAVAVIASAMVLISRRGATAR